MAFSGGPPRGEARDVSPYQVKITRGPALR